MQDKLDPGTLDLFGHRPAGRPKSPHALTPAQRQARYRARTLERVEALKTRFLRLSDVGLARAMCLALEDPHPDPHEAKALWLEFGRRQGWK